MRQAAIPSWHGNGATIHILRAREDNYLYLLCTDTGTALIDATTAEPVLTALQRLGRTLDCVLLTHHHGDHIAGLPDLRRQIAGCAVLGPPGPGLAPGETTLADGDQRQIAGLTCTVMATPGHTAHDLSFHFPEIPAVFTGDTLFVAGCGRLFTGDAPAMWHSLSRLAELPPETAVFCGHEYTAANLRFAQSLEPASPCLSQAAAAASGQLAAAAPTVPSTIAAERACNPFLRSGAAPIRAALDLGPDVSEVDAFACVRQAKDRF
jgi:hydroxyacylglutathione hydrolase